MFDTARKTPVVFFLTGQKSLITVALRVVSLKIRDFQYLKVFPENQGFIFLVNPKTLSEMTVFSVSVISYSPSL